MSPRTTALPDSAFAPAAMEFSLGESVVPYTDQDGFPGTRRVWYVAARRLESDRYWPCFMHHHTFRDVFAAERLLDRVQAAPPVLVGNPHWADTRGRANPMEDLAPFGVEWEIEQQERAGLR